MPYIGPSGELKTKPTQHSVAALRSIGIQPDAIVCRSDRPIPESMKRKISLMCDVDDEAVVNAADAPSIYDIPKVLHTEGLDAYVVRRLNLPFRDVDWTEWDDLLRRVHHPAEEVTVALVGKYIDLPDAYLSVAEALRAGGFAHEAKVKLVWVPSDECQTREGAARHLADVDAVCVPGGFGIRGIEGKVGALEYARTHGIPTLGPVPGPAVHGHRVRPARGRHRRAPTPPSSTPAATEPVIATMAEQEQFVEGAGDLGGTMRLGLYPAELKEGSVVREAYGEAKVEERHRHRYEVNNAYRDRLEEAGLVFSGTSPGQQPGRVRRAAPRRAPLLRRHPGAPRAAVAPDPAAPAVRGPGRGGDRAAAELRFPIDESALRRRDADERRRPHGRRGAAGAEHRLMVAADRPESWPVHEVERIWKGAAPFSVRRDLISAPDRPDERFGRLVLEHPGAVGDPGRRRAGAGAGAAPVPPPGRRCGSSSCRPGCSTSRARTRSSRRAARAPGGGAAARRARGRTCSRRTPPRGCPASGSTSTWPQGLSPAPDRGGFEPAHEEADMTTRVGAGRRAARGRPRGPDHRRPDGPGAARLRPAGTADGYPLVRRRRVPGAQVIHSRAVAPTDVATSPSERNPGR